HVSGGARIAVAAGSGVVREHAARRRAAAVIGADIAVVAHGRRPRDAGAISAAIPARASVAVGTGAAVCLHRVRTGTGGGVAGARVMALIARRAADRIAADAQPGLARIAPGAGVAVIAGRAVDHGRVLAGAVDAAVAGTDVAVVTVRVRVAFEAGVEGEARVAADLDVATGGDRTGRDQARSGAHRGPRQDQRLEARVVAQREAAGRGARSCHDQAQRACRERSGGGEAHAIGAADT